MESVYYYNAGTENQLAAFKGKDNTSILNSNQYSEGNSIHFDFIVSWPVALSLYKPTNYIRVE